MRSLYLLLILLGFTFSGYAQLSVNNLTCEHLVNPMPLDASKPRLSWKLSSPQRNILQTAYQIRVATAADFNKKSLIWDSGKVSSGESILQEYAGPALQSAKRYYWQVKAWDNQNHESLWSPTAWWEMGLLKSEDWKASWVEPEQTVDPKSMPPAPLLRKSFTLNKKIQSARLYVTSHGLNEMYINGKRVGRDLFTPGWTAYQDHLQYFTYNVDSLVKTGANAIGGMLGDGWFRGYLAWEDNRNVYGQKLGLLAQLVVTFSDGSQQVIGTDDTWKANNNGPIRLNDLYNGETYDARMEIPNWANADFNENGWWNVKVVDFPKNNLIAPQGPPVRRIQFLKPQRLITTPQGDKVLDFGQNITGWLRFKVTGSAGTTIKINHAEVLDKKGNFYTTNLRHAKCELNYTLKGQGEETYEPHFTFMGFRYVKITNYPGELKLENFTAVPIHSDMVKTGEFSCSNALLNQLQSNIQWGQRGNFLDVPTDCPQRDERLGWTGDAQAFSRTAAYNYQVAGFFNKWLNDLIADQGDNGGVPHVIPDVLQRKEKKNIIGSSGWGDVCTIAPWNMYLIYGDKRLLERQYNSMEKWVAWITTKAPDGLWKGGPHFGDWLFYQAQTSSPMEKSGYTDPDYIATAFYANSVEILRKTAQVLGKKADETKYAALHDKIKAAFNKEYVAASGRTISDSQTSYVLGLNFNLFEEKNRAAATAQLVKDIKSRGNHLSTGFLGTPYLCHVLSDNGQTEVAYDLLFQQSYPSWLYPVKMGATTIWERWDGVKPDSTFQDAGMNSFNHYAYGAIGDWMYRVTTGLEIGQVGYKHILIQPQPTTKLDFAKTSFQSNYGEIVSGWERKDGKTKLTVKIPANTTATVTLPTKEVSAVREGGNPVVNAKAGPKGVVVEVGSGEYVFEF